MRNAVEFADPYSEWQSDSPQGDGGKSGGGQKERQGGHLRGAIGYCPTVRTASGSIGAGRQKTGSVAQSRCPEACWPCSAGTTGSFRLHRWRTTKPGASKFSAHSPGACGAGKSTRRCACFRRRARQEAPRNRTELQRLARPSAGRLSIAAEIPDVDFVLAALESTLHESRR